MKVTQVRYEIKRTLGQYEHELLEVVVTQDLEGNKSGDDMMKEARRIAVTHTTEQLKKAKGGKQ